MIESATFHVITTELVVGSFALAGLCFLFHSVVPFLCVVLGIYHEARSLDFQIPSVSAFPFSTVEFAPFDF